MNAGKPGLLTRVLGRGAPVAAGSTAVTVAQPWQPPPVRSPVPRARLVYAFDATWSRHHAWAAAQKLQDRLLAVLPGQLEVALAWHSGGEVTFSKFTSNPARLRDQAAGVKCVAGTTQLLPILERVAARDRAAVVLYVGDCFEEDERRAARIADKLRLRETRVIILHDGPPPDAFAVITERTGGALLPFDTSALDRLGDLLQAVAVLAVGNVELVEAQKAALPAASLLLENLDPKRLLIGRAKS